MQAEQMSRREFIRRAVMGATVLTAAPSFLVGYAKSVFAAPVASSLHSDVAAVTHTESVDDDGRIAGSVVQTMVDEGVKTITQKGLTSEAWRALFPSLKSTDVIGIKINCINRRFYSDSEVIDAIVASLLRIGVAENNIIVWDRQQREMTRCGFGINTGQSGVRYMATGEYDRDLPIRAGSNARDVTYLSTILTRQCDHLINVPVLKDHNMAGVTLSMKNHYGSIANPYSFHGNSCDPHIGYINTSAPIQDKTRLIVLDALKGIYRGGPGGSPQWMNRQIIVGTDPVAVDYEGMLVLEAKRTSVLGESMSVIRRARHIQTAAELGVGTNNPEQIDLHDLRLG